MVRWPEEPDGTGPPGTPRGLHWKTPGLTAWAGSRPFVWVDDEIGPVDRLWVEGVHPAPALLHRVDPRRGLADEDFAALAAFVTAAGPGEDDEGREG